MTLSPGLEEVDLNARQGERAGLVSRAISFGVDSFIVVVAGPAMLWGFSIFRGLLTFAPPTNPDVDPGTTALITVVFTFWYFALWWTVTGRTLGQALLGLRVVGRTKQRVGLVPAMVRSAVMMSTVLLVPAWLIISRRRLALHDLAARTQVVYDQAHKVAEIDITLGARAAGP